MMPAHCDAASKLGTAGHTVYPCDCVAVIAGGILQQLKQLLKIVRAVIPHHHIGALYRDELDRHLTNDAG